MADKVAERNNKERYGLVYSRATTGRCKPNEIAKDDDLIIGSLPKKMMKKVVRRRSSGVRDTGKESSLEHCIDNVTGKQSTETITKKGKSKAECYRQESHTNGGVSIGKGQIGVDTVQEDSKNINTPMKQKRGADGEIVRAFFLLPQRSLSRLRPRKEVPAFRTVELEENDNEFVVGKRVKVYWSGSRRWFTGRIVAFDKENRLHRILYEDGDKEVLDLSKERFKLEVMATDRFKLKSEPYSATKADGLVTGNVGEAVLKDDTRNVTGAKTMTKSSESKHSREAKEGKGTSLESLRKDTEVIMEEFEAEATLVKSHSEILSIGSDNISIKESGKAVEDNSLKISIAELAIKPKGSRERLMPRTKRMRTSKVFSSDFGNVMEKLEADVKSHVHCDEESTQMDVDINSEAMDVNHQYISTKNEALKKASEGAEMSNETPFTTFDLTSNKKPATEVDDVIRDSANEVEKENLIEVENRIAEDVIASLLLNPQNVKDKSEVRAAQMEFAAAIKKRGKPGDVDSMNTNHGAESFVEAESMKPRQASYYLQPIVRISPHEAKPNVQGKVKMENGESDKKSKEGMNFILEKSEINASKERQINEGAAS